MDISPEKCQNLNLNLPEFHIWGFTTTVEMNQKKVHNNYYYTQVNF
jgi:hypothetical protein